MEIRESQIEEVLVNSPSLSRDILNLEYEPNVLAKQMILPSGRLDILYTHGKQLLLIELKVVSFQKKFINQVIRYKKDLVRFQEQGKLINGEIHSYLLCPFSTNEQKQLATKNEIICLNYDPEYVLKHFYNNLKPISCFSEIKPIDIGIWNIHLVNDFIYLLEKVDSVSELKLSVRGSPKTLYNKIKFAEELGLIEWKPNNDKISLSAIGLEYIKCRDNLYEKRLSEAQADLLRVHVILNPYESPVILGISSIVEAVFVLAKNTYPVKMDQLLVYFAYHAGKYFDWKTEKSKFNATNMYVNYACNLGLLGKSGDSVFLTPEGFRFVFRIQLHKGLKMTDSINLV